MSTKLLVVEDDDDLRAELEASLAEVGYEVAAVRDGQAALDAIERERPALVLLDVMLPRVDGYAVMAELYRRRVRPQVAVLLLSAAAVASESASWVMADGYVEKPFDLGTLLDRVERLVGPPAGAPRL